MGLPKSRSPTAWALPSRYGEVRWSSGTLPTDYTFTAQRAEASMGGLMEYRARYYDPYINRFIQADSIVPGHVTGGAAGIIGYVDGTRLTPLTLDLGEFAGQIGSENQELLEFGPFVKWSAKTRQEHAVPVGPGDPQMLNRYAYVGNNPLRYVDPTGHQFMRAEEYTYTLHDISQMILVLEAAASQQAKHSNTLELATIACAGLDLVAFFGAQAALPLTLFATGLAAAGAYTFNQNELGFNEVVQYLEGALNNATDPDGPQDTHITLRWETDGVVVNLYAYGSEGIGNGIQIDTGGRLPGLVHSIVSDPATEAKRYESTNNQRYNYAVQ